MRFSRMWYVWPAKAQTSLRICAVWPEPLLVAWIFYYSVKLLTEQNLENLSLTGACPGLSESTLVKMLHCWKNLMSRLICCYLSTPCRKFQHSGLQIRVRTRKLFFLFLNQNICCGYSKESSQWDGPFEHPKHTFKLMGKKIITILR